jgi:hypothetical protein
METSLHQQLKYSYAGDRASTEVVLGRFRIDAVRAGELIEVQCASLSAIRSKCQILLEQHSLRIVKPLVIRTRIAKVKRRGGPITSRRMSPKRGSVLDLFDELIYFTRVFPHPNLTIEVPLIHVEQIRAPAPRRRRRRWQSKYQIQDVTLEATEATIELQRPADLLNLLALPEQFDRFNTADLAAQIDCSRHRAQQIAYVLRHTGAIDSLTRNRAGIVYQRAA